MEIKPYIRRVNYYETDQMSIVHHTNHIRYFEEARVDFMHQIGCDIKELEDMGIIIPNVDAYAKYKKVIEFYSLLKIEIKLVKFNGVSFTFEYVISFADTGEVASTGHTSHCFVNRERKPISIKRTFPEIYKKMLDNLTSAS